MRFCGIAQNDAMVDDEGNNDDASIDGDLDDDVFQINTKLLCSFLLARKFAKLGSRREKNFVWKQKREEFCLDKS